MGRTGGFGTPVPKRETEERAIAPGPMTVRMMTPEERERYGLKSEEKGANTMISYTMNPSKENYLELKHSGLSDFKIASKFKMHQSELSKLKKEWGLSGMTVRDLKKDDEAGQDETEPKESKRLTAKDALVISRKNDSEHIIESILERVKEAAEKGQYEVKVYNFGFNKNTWEDRHKRVIKELETLGYKTYCYGKLNESKKALRVSWDEVDAKMVKDGEKE